MDNVSGDDAGGRLDASAPGQDPDGGNYPSGDGDGDSDAQVPDAPTTGPFPPVTDFTKAGPYATTTMPNVGPNNNFTIYLPTELAPNGAKNPIVSWMNGGGTTHSFYTLLPHLASHGFVVLASNTIPSIGAEVDLGKELTASIDWAIAENERSGSTFFGKLDTKNIAASGYSMGSLATFTMAADPRLTTTLHISGGNMAPDRITNLRAPAAFICGTPGDASCNILSGDCDIAAANCDVDFEAATTPIFYANFAGGHLGILGAPHGERIAAMSAAWLRYQLMGDTTLRAAFVGSSCTYCTDSNWKVQQKNLR